MKKIAIVVMAALVALSGVVKADDSMWQTMKADKLMAVSKDAYDMAWQMILADDSMALAKMDMAGKIKLSKGGEKVQLVTTDGWIPTRVQVRLKGSTRTYWIDVDATDK